MIFISGVHGVGKSYFCEMVKTAFGFNTYSASSLIAARKKTAFSNDKLIPDIESNQQHLLSAIQDLNALNPLYLLDGHFCLLNAHGKITRIPTETFSSLNPDAIVLLTENPGVVARRRKERDGIEHDELDIRLFQDEEISYSKEIAEWLGTPICISQGAEALEDTLSFVQETMRRVKNVR